MVGKNLRRDNETRRKEGIEGQEQKNDKKYNDESKLNFKKREKEIDARHGKLKKLIVNMKRCASYSLSSKSLVEFVELAILMFDSLS